MTYVKRTIDTPPRTGLTRKDLWEGQDKGLIKCWEIGRDRATKFPELAQRCQAGELPVLGWKGGVNRSLKKNEKFGCLKYLAQWQGLRGEDLDIDLSQERTLTCTSTKMIVTFTPDRAKYVNQEPA
ncbi:hypothetical protein HNO91_22670 [Pseudomonas corrugata]|uniref:Uncharacterized protein n=1 Tax=Pseudomonas corrugata TaxID=47879 RepID=A0A7Y5Z991_9PSED|nr:hypothetical protein [Pseudomonas corrugata]NUT89244.1 hypothetical protein [Pseudomonas corrugata]